MVMMIRNTCRMFDNLFKLVGNREMKGLNSPYISVGGLEPVSVVYIEVSNIKNVSVWVFSFQRLMAESKILKAGEKVGSIRGAMAKAKNDSSRREIYFQPENIKVRRFRIHESCNSCVYVTISVDTTFRVETRVKIIAGDLERVRGRLDLTAGFHRVGKYLERRSPNGFQQR